MTSQPVLLVHVLVVNCLPFAEQLRLLALRVLELLTALFMGAMAVCGTTQAVQTTHVMATAVLVACACCSRLPLEAQHGDCRQPM